MPSGHAYLEESRHARTPQETGARALQADVVVTIEIIEAQDRVALLVDTQRGVEAHETRRARDQHHALARLARSRTHRARALTHALLRLRVVFGLGLRRTAARHAAEHDDYRQPNARDQCALHGGNPGER